MQAALPSKFQSGILASPRQQARFLRLDRCVAAYLSLSALVWHRLRQGRTRRLGVRCAQGQNPGARCLSRPAEGPVRRESETNSAKLRRQSSGSGALSQSGREQNARPAEAAGSAGTPLNGASAGRLQRVSLALGARVQGRLGGGGGWGEGLSLSIHPLQPRAAVKLLAGCAVVHWERCVGGGVGTGALACSSPFASMGRGWRRMRCCDSHSERAAKSQLGNPSRQMSPSAGWVSSHANATTHDRPGHDPCSLAVLPGQVQPRSGWRRPRSCRRRACCSRPTRRAHRRWRRQIGTHHT